MWEIACQAVLAVFSAVDLEFFDRHGDAVQRDADAARVVRDCRGHGEPLIDLGAALDVETTDLRMTTNTATLDKLMSTLAQIPADEIDAPTLPIEVALSHVPIERLPLAGRVEVLEQLAKIQAFHATSPPSIPSPALPPATTTGRFAGVTERVIPAIDEAQDPVGGPL